MVNQISNIVHFDTHVSFWVDDAGISTNVDKSISHIYLLDETKRSGKIYTALTYKDTAILDAMSKLIRNESVTDEEVALLNRIYIRYGWVDKLLKQLLFKRFDTLVAGFVNKSLDHTDKNKFNGILKALSLSTKQARHDHLIDGGVYNPLKVTARLKSLDKDTTSES